MNKPIKRWMWRSVLLGILLLPMAGCAGSANFATYVDATPTPSPVTPIPTSLGLLAPTENVRNQPALTEAMLRNGTYWLPMYHESVTLQNGDYSLHSDSKTLFVHLIEPIVFGDWNGDGAIDGAVLLSESGGGSGDFVSLFAILNDQGQPKQAATKLIDDRPLIKNIRWDGDAVVLDAVVHGTEDPMCCPSFAISEKFRLLEQDLILTHFESATLEGRMRSIRIDSSSSSVIIADKIHVTGTTAIAPFENSLGYRFIDTKGSRLSEGSFLITSSELGSAGTFDVLLPSPILQQPQRIFLQILEMSAKDGTLLAMDSIDLLLRENG